MSGAAFLFDAWPTTQKGINQWFGERPQYYQQFGFPGHEGIDIAAPFGTPYFAAAGGRVIWVSDQRRSGGVSAYGWHIIIDHLNGFSSLYAHADPVGLIENGAEVEAGQVIGYSGSTGNSSGPHLHLTLKEEGYQLPGWPPGYHDPYPFLEHLL